MKNWQKRKKKKRENEKRLKKLNFLKKKEQKYK